jgi:hypothetical protein
MSPKRKRKPASKKAAKTASGAAGPPRKRRIRSTNAAEPAEPVRRSRRAAGQAVEFDLVDDIEGELRRLRAANRAQSRHPAAVNQANVLVNPQDVQEASQSAELRRLRAQARGQAPEPSQSVDQQDQQASPDAGPSVPSESRVAANTGRATEEAGSEAATSVGHGVETTRQSDAGNENASRPQAPAPNRSPPATTTPSEPESLPERHALPPTVSPQSTKSKPNTGKETSPSRAGEAHREANTPIDSCTKFRKLLEACKTRNGKRIRYLKAPEAGPKFGDGLDDLVLGRAIATVTEAISTKVPADCSEGVQFSLIDPREISWMHQQHFYHNKEVLEPFFHMSVRPGKEAFLVRTDGSDDRMHHSLYHLQEEEDGRFRLVSYDSANGDHHRTNNQEVVDEFRKHLQVLKWTKTQPKPRIAKRVAIGDPPARQAKGEGWGWDCGIYVILYAWAIALTLDISNFKNIPKDKRHDFATSAIDLITLALQGHASSAMIGAFLKCFKVVSEDDWIPSERQFDRTFPFLEEDSVARQIQRVRLQQQGVSRQKFAREIDLFARQRKRALEDEWEKQKRRQKRAREKQKAAEDAENEKVVDCPICEQRVKLTRINEHIESECQDYVEQNGANGPGGGGEYSQEELEQFEREAEEFDLEAFLQPTDTEDAQDDSDEEDQDGSDDEVQDDSDDEVQDDSEEDQNDSDDEGQDDNDDEDQDGLDPLIEAAFEEAWAEHEN